MYQAHPEFKEPDNPETVLWRYRPLHRFESIIENQALFFASITKLQEMDINEGMFPPANEIAYGDAVEESISAQDLYPDEAGGMRDATRKMYEMWTSPAELPYMVANCWHCNEGESEQMWKEYVGEDGNGVAIKTTLKRLKESFDSAEKKLYYSDDKEIPVYAGMVRYISRDEERITYNPFSWERVLQKERSKFLHERELRVAADFSPPYFRMPFHYVDLPPSSIIIPELLKELDSKHGVFMPIDLNTLIEMVVISPFAPPGLKQRVEELLGDASIEASVVSSNLKK